MELKEQLSDLRYQTSVLINKIKELEQQIKPKIEVGKVYNFIDQYDENWLWSVTKQEGNKKIGFGFAKSDNTFYNNGGGGYIEGELVSEATPEEWTTALTKYCDELYKDCDRVDRTGLDIKYINENISELKEGGLLWYNIFDGAFIYKNCTVMDKHGKFANGLKAEVNEEKLFTKQEVAVILEDYRKFTWNNGATKSDLELWIKENIAGWIK